MALWLYDAEDDAKKDLEPSHTSLDQSKGGEEGEGVSWVNPRKHPAPMMNDAKEQHKVNPKSAEQRKVNSKVKDNAKSIPHTVSTPTDPNVTLSKGQYSYNLAEMAKTGGIPCFEANGSPCMCQWAPAPLTSRPPQSPDFLKDRARRFRRP